MTDEVLDLIRGGPQSSAPAPTTAYPSRSMASSAGRKKPAKREEEDEVLSLIQGTGMSETPAAPTPEKPPLVRQIIGNVLKKRFSSAGTSASVCCCGC